MEEKIKISTDIYYLSLSRFITMKTNLIPSHADPHGRNCEQVVKIQQF
jgi:hypothetical protein